MQLFRPTRLFLTPCATLPFPVPVSPFLKLNIPSNLPCDCQSGRDFYLHSPRLGVKDRMCAADRKLVQLDLRSPVRRACFSSTALPPPFLYADPPPHTHFLYSLSEEVVHAELPGSPPRILFEVRCQTGRFVQSRPVPKGWSISIPTYITIF
uniref:Uncharacterized protein n=1 Tax=Schistocephalus solidus TaxID=70667 RepID=A0A0V0J4H3_SCHSO